LADSGDAAGNPIRPIEVVISFGGGSAVDRVILNLILYLGKDLGQRILPDYKSSREERDCGRRRD
jgi:tripartite-type tricarboxylate transporter receptor subunit TctC